MVVNSLYICLNSISQYNFSVIHLLRVGIMLVMYIVLVCRRFKIPSLCSYPASRYQTWQSSCKFQLYAEGIVVIFILPGCCLVAGVLLA